MVSISSKKTDRSFHLSRKFWLNAIVGATLSIVGVSTYYSYQLLRTSFLEALKQNAILEVQQGVDDVDRWLATQTAETISIANTPTLQTMDWSQVEPYYQAELARLQDFFFFAMVNPDGTYYNTKVGFARNKNIKDRKHIRMGMAGETFISDPVPSRTLNETIVVIATPVWSDNPEETTPIGVTSGIMSLDQVSNVVSNLQYGEGSYAFAFNSEGQVIVRDNDRALEQQENPNFQPLSDRALGKQSGIELVETNGERHYIAYVPLEQANWSIALVIPQDNIESQLRPLQAIAIAILSLAIATALILWQVQALERRELKRSKEAADAANQAKSDFLSNMSHELRTPLNGILGYAQILEQSTNLSSQDRDDVNIIYQCGSHLLNLINDILDLSKIEARKFELNSAVVYLPALLQNVVEMCKVRAEQKGIDFIYQPDDRLPESVRADEKRLSQVLINLLGNGIKFTTTGSVTFRIDGLTPTSPDRARLKFQVSDTGVGISPEDRARLFRAFEQFGDRQKRSEGTGLGLIISQRIVQLMGGTIDVTSELGVGSQFFFTVEFPVVTDWIEHQSSDRPAKIIGYSGERRRILVIDDRQENRRLFIDILKPLGFEVDSAENGLEGLEKMRQQQPDLAIVDIAMPGMDGYEFLQYLRCDIALKTSKAIVSSASVAQEDCQRALEAGADDFLPKPIDIPALLRCLASHLELEWLYERDGSDLETLPSEKAILL